MVNTLYNRHQPRKRGITITTQPTAPIASEETVLVRRILELFVPMALASWLGMLAPPIINAAIVRAADDQESALAAYAVARNLIMVLAPFAIMVPNGFLVLVNGHRSYQRYRNFLGLLAAVAIVMGLMVAATPLHQFVLGRAMGLNPSLATSTRRALVVLLLLPPVGIWRGLSRGALIQQRRTGLMLAGGVAGFVVLGCGVALAGTEHVNAGALYGAIVLVASTAADALVVHFGASRGPAFPPESTPPPTYREIAVFFLPLVLTTWIMGFSRTIIDAGLARTASPEVAIASFSVAASLVFAFESPVVSIRSTVLAFPHNVANCLRLRRFSLTVGGAMTGAVLLMSLTGLTDVVLTRLIGVSDQVHGVARNSVWIMAPTLLILSWRQYNYARLMRQQRTAQISLSAVARIGFLAAGLIVGLSLWPDGRVAAAIYVCGFLLETLVTRISLGKAERLRQRSR